MNPTSTISTYGVLDTSIYSHNLGDNIIMESINDVLEDTFPNARQLRGSTQIGTINAYRSLARHCDVLFVGGTNLLSERLIFGNQWKYDLGYGKADTPNLLIGVGWKDYSKRKTPLGQFVLRKRLKSSMSHSVRDEFTKNKLKTLGIANVLNTCCPTTWNLTPEHCLAIPQTKGKSVLFTLTDYNPSQPDDVRLVSVLLSKYETVYFWPQGLFDKQYLEKITPEKKIKIIAPSVTALDNVLSNKNLNLDYIGTRLHCGIRALKHSLRTIIIGIDNRASEIAVDINLPVVARTSSIAELEDIIEKKFKTELVLPWKNIDLWRSQFYNTPD